MLRPRNSSTPDGDLENRDGQDAWSTAYPPDNDRPFDHHSFGRMDHPVTPPLPWDNLAVGSASHISPAPARLDESIAAPSFSNDLFMLDHILAPNRHDPPRGGDGATSPTRRGESESYEMDEFNTPSKPEKLYRNGLPGDITSYMGLRARLTQVPINRWTVLLMLVLARLMILFESLNTNLASAQDEAASACSKVEEVGSAMASMPYYLSVGVNELVAMGITDAVRGLIKVLMMILSGLLEMLVFIIERTYGTIVCVATSFIKGLMALAAAAIEDLLQGIDDGLRVAVSGLSDAVDAYSKDLDSAVQAVGSVLGFHPPSLSGVDTAIDGLKSANFINATATFASITDFDNKIPDFDAIIADVQAVVGIPFTTVETLLNESFGNWSMDPSIFPTASKEQLTFCTDKDILVELFDVLFIIAKSAKIVAVCGLMLAALLAAALMAWLECQRYRQTVIRSQILRDREPMDTVYISGRPLTAGAGLWISQRISDDPNRRMLIRWVVAYATTYRALFVLSLAIAGAFSVLCQFFIMRALQKEAPGLVQEVGNFVTSATDALEGSSTRWANESNEAMLSLQNDINDKLLIHVQNTTGAVVNLITIFENETTTLLEDFFGNNPIGVAADNFTVGLLDCVIFNTLNKVKSGITWIHQEAHVTLPDFPFNVFSMGATATGDNSSFSSLLTKSGAQTANDITSAVTKVVVTLQSSIVQEGFIALALFLVYTAYVFFAVAQAALRMCCMKERLPEDSEKGECAKQNLRASQDTIRDMSTATRPLSMASSYRLPSVDASQMARELSTMQTHASPIKQSPAEYVEAHRCDGEDEDDPFGDDTYTIGHEDVDMDDVIGALRDPRPKNLIDNSGRRNRQAWVEDTDE